MNDEKSLVDSMHAQVALAMFHFDYIIQQDSSSSNLCTEEDEEVKLIGWMPLLIDPTLSKYTLGGSVIKFEDVMDNIIRGIDWVWYNRALPTTYSLTTHVAFVRGEQLKQYPPFVDSYEITGSRALVKFYNTKPEGVAWMKEIMNDKAPVARRRLTVFTVPDFSSARVPVVYSKQGKAVRHGQVDLLTFPSTSSGALERRTARSNPGRLLLGPSENGPDARFLELNPSFAPSAPPLEDNEMDISGQMRAFRNALQSISDGKNNETTSQLSAMEEFAIYIRTLVLAYYIDPIRLAQRKEHVSKEIEQSAQIVDLFCSGGSTVNNPFISIPIPSVIVRMSEGKVATTLPDLIDKLIATDSAIFDTNSKKRKADDIDDENDRRSKRFKASEEDDTPIERPIGFRMHDYSTITSEKDDIVGVLAEKGWLQRITGCKNYGIILSSKFPAVTLYSEERFKDTLAGMEMIARSSMNSTGKRGEDQLRNVEMKMCAWKQLSRELHCLAMTTIWRFENISEQIAVYLESTKVSKQNWLSQNKCSIQ